MGAGLGMTEQQQLLFENALTPLPPKPIMPVLPRSVSGGSSLKRYLVTGQLKPQPTEVMARNIRPAGAIRASAVGFASVMKPATNVPNPKCAFRPADLCSAVRDSEGHQIAQGRRDPRALKVSSERQPRFDLW